MTTALAEQRNVEQLPVQLLDDSAIGIVVHDDLSILYANEAFRAMLGTAIVRGRLDVPDAVRKALSVVSTADADTVISLGAEGAAVRELRIVTRAIDWRGREALCSELFEIGNRRADSAVRLIRDAAAAIRRTTTLAGALREILALIGTRLGWSAGEIWTPDADDALRRCCGWHAREELAGLFPDGCGASLALSRELKNRLLDQQEIVWYGGQPDLSASQMFRVDQAARAGLHSACGVPVVIDERVVAVLMFYSDELRTPDTLLTESIAAALAPLAPHIQRLRIKTELEEADQRLKLILKGTATWEWDLKTDEVKWDRAFNRLYGLSDDREGGTFADTIERIHPDDRSLAADSAKLAKDSCSGLHVEYRIVRPDGNVRWVLARGITICDEAGTALRMVGACWDETETRSAADKLELLAEFYDENPQPAFRVLSDGTVGERNAAGRDLLASWGVNGDGHIPDDFAGLVAAARRSGGNCLRDVVVDGAVYQANLVPVRGRDYVNVYATDVTVLRRTEAALEHATKMEAIGQLAGGIAHDFNNRLTVILGSLELLEGAFDEGSDSAAILRDARHAAENSSNLVRQLLAISRPQQAEPVPCDVNAVILRLERMLDRCLGESRSFDLALSSTAPRVVMDESGFEDVLVNLTINARDAMDAGDSLVIETADVWLDELATTGKPDLQPGPYVQIAITDTGKGMPPEVRERAFEPFFTTKAGGGTGLGLSMVYSFVRQTGGHVSIYSEPGRGTCIKLYLPVGGEQAVRAGRRADAAGAASVLSGTRVLIVEDQADLRDIAGRIVSDLGCDVHTVGDARAALEYLAHGNAPDVLFTDIVMPGEPDGLGLAEAAERKCPDLKVILTSGYTAAGPLSDYLQGGNRTRHYVTKPYSRESVARAIELAMTGAAPERAAASRRSQRGAGTTGERSQS